MNIKDLLNELAVELTKNSPQSVIYNGKETNLGSMRPRDKDLVLKIYNLLPPESKKNFLQNEQPMDIEVAEKSDGSMFISKVVDDTGKDWTSFIKKAWIQKYRNA